MTNNQENNNNQREPKGNIFMVIMIFLVIIFFAKFVVPAMDADTRPPSSILTGEDNDSK